MKPDIAPPKQSAQSTPAEQDTANESPKHRRKRIKSPASNSKLNYRKIVGAVIILALIITPSAYFYKKSQDAQKQLSSTSDGNKQVVDDFVKKVNKHYLLPTDEQPTLVTVTDVNKVKEQPFFARAENGDKALIYTQSRKAILYRPSQDVVIEVAPLNVDSSTQTETNSTN